MNREDLERLDRDALVARAQEAGVTRARVLTRPELVDELLVRSATDQATRQRARGLFGRARDLIARVVERGLNLPDAAERIRALGFAAPPTRVAPAAVPTVTLAQIYVAQGHRERAVDTLEEVIAREPEHAVAVDLLAKLRDGRFPVPAPVMPPEREDEGAGAQRVAEVETVAASESEGADAPQNAARGGAPAAGGVAAPLTDECVATLIEPTALRIVWSVHEETLAYVRRASPGARVALCVHVVKPTWDGPQQTSTTYEVGETKGELVAGDLPEGCVVRAAVGCIAGERDGFSAFAHSAAAETTTAVH
jgi:hypothetical protein